MKRWLLYVLIAVLFAQCSPVIMALDNEGWEQKEVFEVKGKRNSLRNESLQFGDYKTVSVQRSWTRGTQRRFTTRDGRAFQEDLTHLISADYIRKRQSIWFSMTDGKQQSSDVFCVSRFNTADLTVGNRPNSILNIGIDILGMAMGDTDNSYYVQLYVDGTGRVWEMLIDNIRSQTRPRSYIGYLTMSSDQYYTIQPVYKLRGKNGKTASSLAGTVGFEFRNPAGLPVAAVSLIDRGVVYFASTLPEEKFLLANACAALLMQQQLD